MDLFCKFTPVPPPPGSWKMCTNSWGMRCHALNQKSCGLGGWEEDCIFSSSWHGIIFPCAERPKGKNKIVTGFDVQPWDDLSLTVYWLQGGCWLLTLSKMWKAGLGRGLNGENRTWRKRRCRFHLLASLGRHSADTGRSNKSTRKSSYKSVYVCV